MTTQELPIKLFYFSPVSFNKNIPSNIYADMLRINVLYMIQKAKSGHIASTFSSIDIMTCLHRDIMGPNDFYITSKGHDVAGLYAYLISIGKIPLKEMHNYRQKGGLDGHPNINVPEIYCNTGSLGMGISKAKGFGMAKKMRGESGIVYVLIGDGETDEGQTYEALKNMFNHKVDNIRVIIDNNKWSCWNKYNLGNNGYAVTFDGHNIINMISLKKRFNNPKDLIYIADTIKGKGVSFMEDRLDYHSGCLNKEEYKEAVNKIYKRIKKDCILHNVTIPTLRDIKADTKLHKFFKKRKVDIRYLYADVLTKFMREYNNALVLDADLKGDCGLSSIPYEFPDRFIQFGISEQDMVSTASTLATSGYIPIVNSFAAFLCRRANEQIYNICTELMGKNRKLGTVILVGSLAGKLPSGPGMSHECKNDIDIMKTMPDIKIYKPRSEKDIYNYLVKSTKRGGVNYISLRVKY